jgi:glycosyltransferase involved in cell wall biosynthesis
VRGVSRRLAIITEIISPYRIPLFNALSQRSDIELHVIFLAENDPGLRQWQVYKEEIRFSYEILPSFRYRLAGYNLLLNFGMSRALRRASPEAILCGGYNYPAAWQALMWARANGIRFHLWSESHLQELHRGQTPWELLKREFMQRCDGFVVPGSAARQYLLAHKMKPESIFTAVNAVDNELFASGAAIARSNAEALRQTLQLPARYILFVGRLVREKGVFELLSAYAKLDDSIRQQVGMVFVGDGASGDRLQREAASICPGMVRFPGFAQREQLPAYYALAEMLVLPTYTDTWALVVNEAMACGLPVVLTRTAGCAPDLITENWNGLLVPPRDVLALTRAMNQLLSQRDVRAIMADNSEKRILEYSPEIWATGIAEMMGTRERAID